MKPVNNKHHPQPQGLAGGRRKYRKYTCDQDMSCTMIPSSPISTRYRGEHDDTIISSESSANSTLFSLSTCTSLGNEVDLGDDGKEDVPSNRHGSISMLNSQLLNAQSAHLNPSRQNIAHKDYTPSHTRTLGNVVDDAEFIGSNVIRSSCTNTTNLRAFGKRHHRFKEKLENIDFALRRDENRLKHELSKEATINHNRIVDTLMEDTDYDADYDDDIIQEELNEIIDYEQMELEERFQELSITKF
ncbi:hypothetical protein PICMEDRAFT_58986 [Pichia membranifaciens NRRL Y-2026]|uniref:Uncharacterized protein n=1 Tax=Pichia membranifaciens NRRL Y-2026 TaxID=763406 RepID=A0A1E3NKZ0_9ASCO|nr:hypothetical protein PICMEDRAFT_58986 [Pichia membranifaciens NRRL Y-2026]ODQ46756.1 hypothetical protein PICMEDRAFT_58986 [Pichia membranifaciens NRRL Y-2026]